jgi:hypothetical protein
VGWQLLAAASFFPLLGVPLAAVGIVAGVIKRRQGGGQLIVVAVSGLALWGAVFASIPIAQHFGGFLPQERQLTQIHLAGVLHAIEFHKNRTGAYPPSLGELQVQVSSPLLAFDSARGGEPQPFHYELREGGSRYTLFALGADGIPGTDDDILPELNPDEFGGLGFQYP